MKNGWLLLGVVVLVVVPLWWKRGAEFAGADSQAEGVVAEVAPQYTPWIASWWEPPSGEIESLLFCTQAALGAGVLGYCLGRRNRRVPADKPC